MAAPSLTIVDPEASDEELMRLLAAGRQEALAPLYARYAPLVAWLAERLAPARA